MNIEVNVEGKTEDYLRKIAKLKNCSINTAAQIVLERYAQRTKAQIERSLSVADKVSKSHNTQFRNNSG
jgi:hypothetical protein